MTWAFISSAKSGKREVAISLFLLWAYLTGYLFLWLDHGVLADYRELYTTLTTATFTFGLGAFGIDFAVRSGLLGGGGTRPSSSPPSRTPQHTSTREAE